MENENAPGRFYVDQKECINCHLCADVAPDIFGEAESSATFVVKQQPLDAEDWETREAMEVCPTSCIHDDGVDRIGERIPRNPIPPSLSSDIHLPQNE